ncbi:hypothetical protein [Bosea rubneri]|uniref:Uncharacterized protein n=1 Tax=Bosea rubneri TaxID=3075434 RepID=A0ABU3SFX5_9HYPH|nr:hypothetical protein [Bosea sp. ZW T0_25]MDU0343700.1 hypothetical protein [Bosea sp. ZW T0_25]
MKSKTDYKVPSYPNHLTKEERGAAFEKAARDYVDSLGIENKGAPLTHGDFARHHAGYLIVARWHKQRIEALEEAVAELRAARLPKPRGRVQAGSNA